MPSRALTARERPLVRALQTTRTLLVITAVTVVVAVLNQADPDHHFAAALFGAAHAWAHAAFPNQVR